MISFDGKMLGEAAVLESIGVADKEIPKILSASLNKTAISLRAAGVRMATRQYNVKAGEIRKRLTIKKASPVYLTARLDGTGKASVPLVQFRVGGKRVPSTSWRGSGARRTAAPARGVSVMVKRQGGKKIIRGGFVAKMKSGHIGLFVRHGDDRLPIEERFGPSPIRLLNSGNFRRELDVMAADLMDKNVKSYASHLLDKMR